jgi:hypothetical protein
MDFNIIPKNLLSEGIYSLATRWQHASVCEELKLLAMEVALDKNILVRITNMMD